MPGQSDVGELSLEDLLEVRGCYNDALGRPPEDLDQLADTHMLGEEVVRALHYKTSRATNVRQRADKINEHKSLALSVAESETAMRKLVAEGELHRLECQRFSSALESLAIAAEAGSWAYKSSGLQPFSEKQLGALQASETRTLGLQTLVLAASKLASDVHRVNG
ncbi:hypothetical protein KEM54_004487 [Ascosphaera aggregata]|nr:hypothetical protein KEM54_004487 [Ascosphaera aggregata]